MQPRLDHVVIHVSDWKGSSSTSTVPGWTHTPWPAQHGARGRGTSVYFRDPDGSLLELIAYPE